MLISQCARSLSTSVLSTDLDIHFGPLSLRPFASSVLFTDLTWKTKMQLNDLIL